MSILKIKDSSGIWQAIRTLKGDKGDHGDPVDVRINGQSILDAETAVAEIPIAKTREVFGLMSVRNNTGITVGADGQLLTSSATETNINGRNDSSGGTGRYYAPIVPNNLDYAVKAALTDGRGADYTEAERKAVRERISVSTSMCDMPVLADFVTQEDTAVNYKILVYPTITKLKKFVLTIVFSGTQQQRYVYFGFNNEAETRLGMNCRLSGYTDMIVMSAERNKFDNRFYGTYYSANSTGNDYTGYVWQSNQLKAVDDVTSLYIYSSTVIPAGTRIIIYGE